MMLADSNHRTTEELVVGSRIYTQIKNRLLAGEFPSGKRIVPEKLAAQYTTSVTPVREALIRLSSERLINEVPKSGFFAKDLSEHEISELFELQLMALNRSLSKLSCTENNHRILKPPEFQREFSCDGNTRADTVVRVANELFVHLAMQSGYACFVEHIKNINDRTSYVRKKDHELFGEFEKDLASLCHVYYEKEFSLVSEKLDLLFSKQIERLPVLIRMLRSAGLRDSA